MNVFISTESDIKKGTTTNKQTPKRGYKLYRACEHICHTISTSPTETDKGFETKKT